MKWDDDISNASFLCKQTAWILQFDSNHTSCFPTLHFLWGFQVLKLCSSHFSERKKLSSNLCSFMGVYRLVVTNMATCSKRLWMCEVLQSFSVLAFTGSCLSNFMFFNQFFSVHWLLTVSLYVFTCNTMHFIHVYFFFIIKEGISMQNLILTPVI